MCVGLVKCIMASAPSVNYPPIVRVLSVLRYDLNGCSQTECGTDAGLRRHGGMELALNIVAQLRPIYCDQLGGIRMVFFGQFSLRRGAMLLLCIFPVRVLVG